MSDYILTTDAVAPGVRISEEVSRGKYRRWRVIGRNKHWRNGWDIKEGSCTRLIFQDDFMHYHLS